MHRSRYLTQKLVRHGLRSLPKINVRPLVAVNQTRPLIFNSNRFYSATANEAQNESVSGTKYTCDKVFIFEVTSEITIDFEGELRPL